MNFISRMPGHQTMRPFFEQVNFDPMTAAYIGFSVLKGASEMSQSRREAKAIIAEGNIAASNKAKEVARKAASQQVSFLNSGLTLEGTPMNIIDSTFNTGLEDINQTLSNYNTAAKNKISGGRTAFIGSLASGFTGASIAPSIGSWGDIGSTIFNTSASIGGMFNGSPAPFVPFGDYYKAGV